MPELCSVLDPAHAGAVLAELRVAGVKVAGAGEVRGLLGLSGGSAPR